MKNLIPFLIAASVGLVWISPAQTAVEANYDIVAHRVRLRILPTLNSISVVDTLTIRPSKQRLTELVLGLPRVYRVEGVTVNRRREEFKRETDYVRVKSLPRTEELEVTLTYSGELAFRSEFSRITFRQAILREEEVLVQGPKALEFARVSLVVPGDWEGFAVGRRAAAELTSDSATYVYEFDQPLSTLGWMAAGRFWKYESPGSPVSIAVRLFDPDSVEAQRLTSLARDALRFYSRHFTPYRFPALTIIQSEDWLAGGNVLAVASPSIVFLKERAFTSSDRFEQIPAVLPHEIAHEWWPLTVFVQDEDVALLSEGMCEYVALLFNKSRGTLTLRDSLGIHPLLRPLIARVTKGRDIPLLMKADLRALPTQYLKSAYVHNMLGRILGGDTLMLHLYGELSRRFNFKRARVDDFEKLAEEMSGKSLTWFFDQWVRRPGIPRMRIYNVKAFPADGGWITRGRARMVAYSEKHATFVDVGVETKNGMHTATVWLGIDSTGVYRNDVPFEIATVEKPLRAILDPQADVLKMQKLPAKFGDLRDPADGVMIVGTAGNHAHLMDLARRDSAELERLGWSIRIKMDVDVTLGDLQNDRVFLYGKTSDNRIAAEQERRFPFDFGSDSVAIGGVAQSDGTLSLVQIVDSPFIAQGLVCWIAPFGDQAEPEWRFIDASWAVLRGKQEIQKGVWKVSDDDLVVEIE
jgi:hypothetical protein